MKTVHQLRLDGYKVYVDHYRYFIEKVNCDYIITDKIRRRARTHAIPILRKYSMSLLEKAKRREVFARGGETSVTLTLPYGRSFSSMVNCSIEDNYNKKEGVSQALSNLLTKHPELL